MGVIVSVRPISRLHVGQFLMSLDCAVETELMREASSAVLAVTDRARSLS